MPRRKTADEQLPLPLQDDGRSAGDTGEPIPPGAARADRELTESLPTLGTIPARSSSAHAPEGMEARAFRYRGTPHRDDPRLYIMFPLQRLLAIVVAVLLMVLVFHATHGGTVAPLFP